MTIETQYHYQVIARAIRLINENREQQPDLEELARLMNISPSHFQRVFTEWVGISPKRYLQYLNVSYAKTLLKDRKSVLDASLLTGLSSPSRLHDAFYRCEAMSPGAYAKAGAGLEISYGWHETRYGDALIMATSKGICGLAFAAEFGREKTFNDMCKRWPKASFVHAPSMTSHHADTAFGQGAYALHLIGAPFQIKVWEALLQIPSGHVTTYSDLAEAIGSPKAVRAVGTAVGKNPISLLIPCHRALRKDGALGGYHWGLEVKQAILAWEAARSETS